jgi:hypothetical protein
VEGVHLQHLLHLTAELLSYESYLEYYTHRQDLDPPLTNVMDMFKSTTRNDPQAAILTHDELNAELVSTRDSTHHGYVMLAKTDRQLIVVHCLLYYQAPLGVANQGGWHQKLFALTGNLVGSQMPQIIQWSTCLLDVVPWAVQVSKLDNQIAALMNVGVDTLPPVAVGEDTATYTMTSVPAT